MADEVKKEGAPETKGARIVPNAARERFIPLDFPIEYDGTVIEQIRIRRVTGKEVADYMASMGSTTEFVVPPVIECPLAVWEAMDADDQEKVEVAATDFFPRRLKEAVTLLLQSGGPSSGS